MHIRQSLNILGHFGIHLIVLTLLVNVVLLKDLFPAHAADCSGLTGVDLTECNNLNASGNSSGNSTGNTLNSGGNTINQGESEKLENPLKFKTIVEFLVGIIDILLIFALPIIILYIMYGGYLFVTARGNESQISTAKSAVTWAIIGGIVVLGAKVIIEVIQGTVDAFQP